MTKQPEALLENNLTQTFKKRTVATAICMMELSSTYLFFQYKATNYLFFCSYTHFSKNNNLPVFPNKYNLLPIFPFNYLFFRKFLKK